MPDKMWINEPIPGEREISVRLTTLAGASVAGMLNTDALIKIAKPGSNFVTDAAATLTEVTGSIDGGSYRMRVSADAVSVAGEVEYEITDATGAGRFLPVHGYFAVSPLETSQYYGQAAGGGVNFVLLDAAAVAVDGYFASATSPAVAVVVAGKGAGQARIANGYIGVNQQLAVTPNWTVGEEPDDTSIIRLIPLTGTGGAGGGGVATVDNSAIASAVLGFVLDPLAPAIFRTPQQLFNVLAAWLAGQGDGFPFNVQQQSSYQSVGDPTKTRLATVISGGKRTVDTADGT